MSKKFFSFLHGQSVHLAPETKIIPGDSLSQLLEGEKLIEQAKSDIEKYKEEVRVECEKLKEEAKKQGYEAGYQQWLEKIATLEQEILKVRKEMEKVVMPVALKAAKKILGREIELSQTAIVDIVSHALKAVSQHKKITIYVNKKDLGPLEKGRQNIKDNFENLEVLSLRERGDVLQGGCIIETESGIINAQLENQWTALEKAFSSLMKPKEVEASSPEPSKESSNQDEKNRDNEKHEADKDEE